MKLKPTQPIVDLKDPIPSTDFVSLESIKNHRKTIALKSVDDKQHMPRADQQGTVQKAMEEAATQKGQLTLGDWQWLRDTHQQAVLIDELKRRAQRELGLAEIRLTDEERARDLAALQEKKRIAANLASANELYRIRDEQIIRAEREWRDWIDKIDQKTIQNKRENLERFMRMLGFKLHYIRQAWNQKHLTEITKSLTSITLDRQAESQHLEMHLNKAKQDMIRSSKELEKIAFDKTRIQKFMDLKEWRDVTLFNQRRDDLALMLRTMGLKLGYLPLPIKTLEIYEKNEKITRMKLESKADQQETSTAQSGAAEDKNLNLTSNPKTSFQTIALPAGEQRATNTKPDPSEPSSPALQRPPQKPKLFKPAFQSIAPNSEDLKEQNDSLDRLALDKKRTQLENIETVNLKMSQLQAASQLLQSSLVTSELNKSTPVKDAPVTDVRQRIKAAK